MDADVEGVPPCVELEVVRCGRSVWIRVLTVASLLLVAYDRAEVYGAIHADTSRAVLSRDGILPVICWNANSSG